MKRVVGLLLLMLLLSACQSKQSVVSEEVSPSGLEYTLVTMPENSRISIRTAWATDWAFDNENNQAVPYIGTRLMLAGGAQGYPAGEVVERFADLDTQGDLGAAVDYIFGTLHYSPEHQAETLKIANAHLRSPALDDKWFKRIRDEVAQGIKQQRADASALGFEAMRWSVFGDQAIRAAVSLDEDQVVESATADEVAKWAASVFNRRGATIAIAGDLSNEEAGLAIDALFDGFPEGEAVADANAELDFAPTRLLLHKPESQTSTLSFIGKLPPMKEGSEFEDFILIDVLGGGAKSVLFNTVRADLRASYRYEAGAPWFTRDHRILVLTGEIDTAKIAEAEVAIRKAYADFRANGVIVDLDDRKKRWKEIVKEESEDTGAMSIGALLSKLDGQGAARVLQFESEVEAISAESIKQRLNTAYPSEAEFIVLVNSPDANALPDACVITEPSQAAQCD